MVRPISLGAALALLIFGAADLARAQLDLTPAESFYEVEGIRVPNVTFRNGAKKIAYSPPGDWTLSGGGKKLTLTPRDKVQVGATIETEAPRVPLPSATPENIKTYTDLAISLVPREATKIEIVEAIVCPMRISGKPMIEVTLSYAFFGQQFRMNTLFLPLDQEQLRFQFIARTADFAPLLKDFRASLFSMQGL